MEDNRDETAKKVFLFPVEYFTAPGFLKRFDFDVKRLRTLIRFGNDREIARDSLNAFMTACFSAVTDEDTRTHMHLEFYSTLAYYGEIYSSEQTFENIISNFERTDMRAKLFGKQPMRSFIVYGDVLLKYYGLKNQQSDGWYTSEGFEIITKAKYYILKAYSQSLEGKNKFSKSDQSYCLVLLASCYMHLSRWFEPVYYLNLLKTKNLKDPNFDYLTVLNLDALKDKSCLDYNGQLLLKIIECGDNVVLNAAADDRQKAHVEKIIENAKENIRRAKLTVDKLKKHKDKVESEQKKRNPYFIYCAENHLFLNEHSLFCKCGRSVGDTLEIKTQHNHTQLEWVGKFERLLELLVLDFEFARGNLYQADSPKGPSFYYKKENHKARSLQLKKDVLLKNSFKVCYSILDQISNGVFEVMEIDVKKYLKDKADREGKAVQHVYFLNMWDLYTFTVDDFRNNMYLISLYSIAKDLDRDEYAALRSFKDYRNTMEHKFLFIEGEEVDAPSGLNSATTIKRSELLIRTKLLMILTKSAILSFAYLVRRQSKVKEVAEQNNKS